MDIHKEECKSQPSDSFISTVEEHAEANTEIEHLLNVDSINQIQGSLSIPITHSIEGGDAQSDIGEDQLIKLEEDENPIDDSEFSIPVLDFEPTLESILTEDGDSNSEEDGGFTGCDIGFTTHQLGNSVEGSDTASIISDNKSRTSTVSSKRKGGSVSSFVRKKPNSILRHVILKGITSSIQSAIEKLRTGTPTAICVGNLVAIGMSHGHVLVFDVLQSLKWCLTGDQSELRDAGGAVSSLAMNTLGNRLLVGYAKGLILMYDLTNGKLLRTIKDGHAVATAVLTLRFTDYPELALCGDSGGSVFELNFKRTMGVRTCDSRCIFSGSRGEVTTFEPLRLASFPDNPISKVILIAFATLSKIIVVKIRPKLKVLFTQTLPGDPSTLPLVSWQMVVIQTTLNEKILDPVLTFGRQNMICFYQITADSKGKAQFLPLRTMNLNYSILSMHWLNSRTLALVDSKEKLYVLDVRSQEELECVDLTGTKLVYASSQYKGLATGGNVSRALALAGERACYNSILCYNNQIVILGTSSVHALTVRLWYERLDHLVRNQHYLEAIQLGYEFYIDKARAVVGLKGNKDSKRIIVGEKILFILDRLVEKIPSFNFMEDLSTAKKRYFEVVSTCINYYVLLGYKDQVYNKLFEVCSENPFTKSAYLEALEPFILNDQLRDLPPIIAKDFTSYYDELRNYKALEACIVHMDVTSLDIHQVMKLCWTQSLYDAIIYIFNKGMEDYVTPIEELMTELGSALRSENSLTEPQITLGNKLLVYISCCLAGRAYPYGNIDASLAGKVQNQVFQLIISLHSRNSTDSEISFPYLRTFLQFDTREFLNVLALSFEEPLFKTELGKRQKQRIVDILLQVMVEQGNFTPTQVGILFTFIARQMAKPDNTLFVSKLLFEQVLEHLTGAKEQAHIDERQQALIELLQAGGFQHFDHDKLLSKCLKAKFFRVCEMLHERRNDYASVIPCYLQDEGRKQQVFSFLHKIFSNFPKKKDIFKQKVYENLQALVEIDPKKFAQVVYLHMDKEIFDLVKSLDSIPTVQYSFLQGLFYQREDNQNSLQLDISTTEKYIRLMCQFNPKLVSSFLKGIESYRFDQTLEICKKHNLTEAMAYLLEKEGRIKDAFAILLEQFQLKLKNISDLGADQSFNWSLLQANFLVLIQFSQRNSPKLIGDDKEALWLPIFQMLAETQKKFTSVDSNICEMIAEMNKHLVESMMSHCSLTTVVEIVLNNPSYRSATFAEIRDLISGMLETCTYEEIMIDLVNKITKSDVFDKMERKGKLLKRGITTLDYECILCKKYLCDESIQDILIFQCGHSCHVKCFHEKAMKGCNQCSHTDTSSKNFEGEAFYSSQRNVDINIKQDNEHESEIELKLEVPFKISLQNF